jgi:hypothetical protein
MGGEEPNVEDVRVQRVLAHILLLFWHLWGLSVFGYAY